jgi:NTE family protein
MHYFDSRNCAITTEHIMASGALPPAFPAVREDEFYWDGGILSNTPTEVIFDDCPRRNSLIFAVHLWNPTGLEPRSIWEVLHRQKDIQYSSRIASHITRQQQTHRLRHVVSQLLRYIPGGDAQQRDRARTGRLRLCHADARRAAARAAPGEREPHKRRSPTWSLAGQIFVPHNATLIPPM